MDKFMFFSRSADKPPGKGVNEQLVSNPEKYKELSQIKNWRRMLSKFYKSEFELDGLRWLSVEHFYQGSKFKRSNPEWYYQFSLDSGSEISKSPLLAKKAGSKTGGGIRPKSIKIDPQFFSYKNSIFKRAMLAKFSQNPKLKNVLLATKDAQLLHKTRGQPVQRIKVLEEVRRILSKPPIKVSLVGDLEFNHQIIRKVQNFLYEAEELDTHDKVFIWIVKDEIKDPETWEDRMVRVFSEECPPEVFCVREIVQSDKIGLITEYLRGYNMNTLLSINEEEYDLDLLCVLYKKLLKGINFYHKRGFQHGNIKSGSNIIFSSKTIKIGGVPSMAPTERELPLRQRDTYQISVIIDNLVRGRKIPKNFRDTLNKGIRQIQPIYADELLKILSCES